MTLYSIDLTAHEIALLRIMIEDYQKTHPSSTIAEIILAQLPDL